MVAKKQKTHNSWATLSDLFPKSTVWKRGKTAALKWRNQVNTTLDR